MFSRLLHYLTVHVSDLFRDPSFWKAFREQIVPELATYPSPRIWCAGASTGEEVYSVAITLAEEGILDRSFIYATDIAPQVLERARDGVYPLDRFITFAENHHPAGGEGAAHALVHGAGATTSSSTACSRIGSSSPTTASRRTTSSPKCRRSFVETCSFTSKTSCKIARSASSSARFAAVAFSASARRSRCSDHLSGQTFEPFAPEEKWYRRR